MACVDRPGEGAVLAVSYPWGHFQFGVNHLAWCNRCDSSVSTWTQPWGELALPKSTRKAIDNHLAGCGS